MQLLNNWSHECNLSSFLPFHQDGLRFISILELIQHAGGITLRHANFIESRIHKFKEEDASFLCQPNKAYHMLSLDFVALMFLWNLAQNVQQVTQTLGTIYNMTVAVLYWSDIDKWLVQRLKSASFCIRYTNSFTVMISFVFSSWIINEFHKIGMELMIGE
jgi:hypothetical protein